MGYERIGWSAVMSLALASCATAGPASVEHAPAADASVAQAATERTPAEADAPSLGDARWVETEPHVRTLLVSPRRVAEVARPGEKAAKLAIGSFYARYDSPDGPLDQLALMVVLEGESAIRVLASGRSLLLEIDGEFFQGEPGLGSNNVHWDPSDGGRATLAISISPEILRALAGAELVRGRIGAYGSFDFRDRDRARLADLLGGLPDDYNGEVPRASVRAIAASM